MADDKAPEHLEYKNTKGTVLGYTAAPVPHANRVGPALSEDERTAADGVTGSPAQGNGLTNSALQPVGGVTTASGGTQSTPVPSDPAQASRKR